MSLPKLQADLEERILEILTHLRYQIEKYPPSSQDHESKSINISFYLFRKNYMKLKQNFHGEKVTGNLMFLIIG